MGKPTSNRSNWNKAKDDRQAQGKYKNVTQTERNSEIQSPSTSGSFFVSAREKQEIVHEKEAKNSKRDFKSKFKSRNNDNEDGTPKKEFDKKKWRMQKYSKKYKLQQWEDKKKKSTLREYYKQVKHDDKPKLDVQKIYEQYDSDSGEIKPVTDKQQELSENENNLNRDVAEGQTSAESQTEENVNSNSKLNVFRKGKKKPFQKAHEEFERIKREKQVKKEGINKSKAEKVEALKLLKQKKFERYKKLNKKTKKGQPIMKYRMEMLLEEIQKTVQ